jgi:hypothetical protein
MQRNRITKADPPNIEGAIAKDGQEMVTRWSNSIPADALQSHYNRSTSIFTIGLQTICCNAIVKQRRNAT